MPANKTRPDEVKGTSTIAPPLIQIDSGMPKMLKKGPPLGRMESVVETNPEPSDAKSSSASTPSAIHKSKNCETPISTSMTLPSPQDILTEKLLASSTKNEGAGTNSEDNDFSDENDDTQNTDDLTKSTEKLYNGNNYKAKNPEIV